MPVTQNLTIVPFDPALHPIDEITELLHQSYAQLLRMGLHFWATTQGSEVTLDRLTKGTGLVALLGERIVGTISYYPLCDNNDCEWYGRPEVSRFGQFAVRPELQQAGIGQGLIAAVEALARRDGKTELALDTSEQAHHLLAYYHKKGFRQVGTMQWHGVNYRSVIMSKSLG